MHTHKYIFCYPDAHQSFVLVFVGYQHHPLSFICCQLEKNSFINRTMFLPLIKSFSYYVNIFFECRQELEHPLIIIHDKKISDMHSLVRILELAIEVIYILVFLSCGSL